MTSASRTTIRRDAKRVQCVNCGTHHGVDEPCMPLWLHPAPRVRRGSA